MDRVVHTIFVVVVALAYVDDGNPGWKKYDNKNYGSHDFQIEIAIYLINYAIKKEWDCESKRKGQMRQKEFIPCNCEEYCFCLNGFTTGIAHKQRKRKLVLHCNCGQTIRTNKCVEARVDIDKHAKYCNMCTENNWAQQSQMEGNSPCQKRRRRAITQEWDAHNHLVMSTYAKIFGLRDTINISEKRLKLIITDLYN